MVMTVKLLQIIQTSDVLGQIPARRPRNQPVAQGPSGNDLAVTEAAATGPDEAEVAANAPAAA